MAVHDAALTKPGASKTRIGIRPNREAHMTRCQGPNIGGFAPARHVAADRRFFELGMTRATGATAADRISAHKWFNLAAMHGNKPATLMRAEIAAEMSETEIAAAQRAARDWLATH
jgi:hypothetical protein